MHPDLNSYLVHVLSNGEEKRAESIKDSECLNFIIACIFYLTPLFGVCSGSKSAIVTNTTVEIIVPENVIRSVYGENGSNLARLRQVTHALSFEFNPSITSMLALFPF